ncbi:hypothetical protein TSAR_011252 [Trichomalopsis sarcophagae]|uniref:THAP-type domain-containing protein n=1 Tax=Trichomalopsis sarcophagae TaxID=543379 RepID=A0A232F9D4_9HYME|nr:hypothetical protein TSAR_011252 [Trichomalopsis sarcophagae]
MAPKKPCAVMFCPSGRYADAKSRKMFGLKQTSLFKVPDRADLRKKWSSLLYTGLYDDDVVCEHHFRDEDVIRTITRRIGGKLLNIPSRRYRLAKDAVPMELDRKKPDRSEGSNDNQAMSENSTIPAVVDSCQAEQSNVDVQEDSSIDEIRSSTPLLPEITDDVGDNCLSILKATVSNIADDYKGLEVEILLTESCESLETTSNDDTEEIDVTDTSETIKDYCSTNPLPPSWSWYQENDKILFAQLNAKKREIRCFVEYHFNLHAKVFTADNRQIHELSRGVWSIADLIDLFKKIEAVIVCEGSSGAKSRSDECCGIVKSDSNNAKYVHHTSCLPCRKLKKASSMNKGGRINKLPSKKQMKKRQDKWLEKILTHHMLSILHD